MNFGKQAALLMERLQQGSCWLGAKDLQAVRCEEYFDEEVWMEEVGRRCDDCMRYFKGASKRGY